MNSKFLNKAGAALMAATMVMNGSAVLNTGTAFAAETKYEFEDAKISGEITVEDNADASGGKALKMTDSGTIEMTFNVDKGGVYNIIVYCGGIGGAKQQNLKINGVSQGALGVPESDGFEAVKVPSVKLNEGENTIVIEKSWGWSNFDYMTVEEAVLAPITASQTTPVDKDATAETKNLMSYFASVYGEHIISGQQEIYQHGPHGLEQEFEYLEKLTGHMPAIRGFDYGNFCCPAFGSDDGSTDRIIDWVKNKNGIATASFHLNVPTDTASYTVGSRIDFGQTTYSEKTDFSPSKVIIEGTKENQYYMQALTTLAGEFKKLEAEGIPVLWRPLHEAEGGGGEEASWFWWGREGSKAYKDLWKFTYKTLTEDFGCHNLIWEWNSYNFDTSADWYPGDEYVDIIGYDKYNCTQYLEENNWAPSLSHNDSAIASTFYGIMEKYASAKMVAMSENDCFSTVENLTGEKAGWLYFLTWYDGGSDNINFLTNPVFNTEQDTIDMYQSEYCITLDELPADLYSKGADPKPTQTTTSENGSTTTTTTTTATTKADPSKNYGKVDYDDKKNSFAITLPKAEKEFYIDVELPKGIEYANGGMGVSVELDGEYYWANIKWEAKASGSVKVNVIDDFYNCSLGTEVIEDKALVEKIKAELGKATEYEGQVWYAQKNGEAAETDGIKINSVYTNGEGSTTTTNTTGSGSKGVKGDANNDGKVNVADAVLIMQSLSNGDEYVIPEEQADLADVYNHGDGLTNGDALVIQMVEAKVISADDLPYEGNIEL